MQLRATTHGLQFASDYLDHLTKYVGGDDAALTWLFLNASRMQSDLGPSGVVDYKPPFEHVRLRNVPVVPTLLQEVRRGWRSTFDGEPTVGAREAVNNLQEFILMHAGGLQERHHDLTRRLRSPLEWFREGSSTLFLVPVLVLYGVGLVSSRFLLNLGRRRALRLLSALVVAIGLLGSIITIALGWPPFRQIIWNAWQAYR